MYHNSLRFICVVAALCMVGACSEDEDVRSEAKHFSPEIQAMRECLHRDGKLTRALEAYRFGIGKYPSTKQGLKALLSRPKGLADPKAWQGPYLEDEDCLNDYWGNPYNYKFPGKTHEGTYDIISAGPDGQMSTDDDILNWDIR